MSFQRRSNQPALKGVRVGLVPSTPSGVPQLDVLLGGGIPLGSVVLLAEDRHNVYGRQLAKAFIAEGIAHNHKIVIIDGESFLDLDELPRKVMKDQSKHDRCCQASASESMKIAFRYERLPQHESLPEGQSDHIFDFGLNIEPDDVAKADVTRCHALIDTPTMILQRVAANIADDNVLRLIVTAGLLLDSKFVRQLKILIRHKHVVCWVSAPACIDDDNFQRLFAISDTVLSLVAFSSEERKTNPLYKKFHGLLSLDKFAEINSITGHRPSSVEYTFHQSRRRFAIEQLHLPPELGDSGLPTLSCQGAGGTKSLDF